MYRGPRAPREARRAAARALHGADRATLKTDIVYRY